MHEETRRNEPYHTDPAPEWIEYFSIIREHLAVVLAMTGIVVLCATVYYSTLPNLYTANVQILVERIDPNSLKSSQEGLMVPTFKGEEDYYGTQLAILT